MTILILGALEEEVQGIRSAMENVTEEKVGAFVVWRGKLNKKSLLLCRCGIGKVNASAAASAILTCNPDVAGVINTGVAGGVGKGLRRGDVVLGTKTVQHDVDSTPDGLRKGQIDGFESEFFDADPALSAQLIRALTREGIPYREGVIASGDQFIASDEKANAIACEFGALACEMESAAIAQVCALYKVPFVALRAISDNGGDNAIGSFYEFLHTAAEKNVRAIKRFTSDVETVVG